MEGNVRTFNGVSRLEAAVAQIRLVIQRGQARPGQSLSIRDLADQFRVPRTQLRLCLDSLERMDLLTVRPDVVTVAPLDLTELRSAMKTLEILVIDMIARSSDRIGAVQLRQLREFVSAMPRYAENDTDLYDTGRVFMERLIGVSGTRYERSLYGHAIDMVSRYEYLGGAVLERAGDARALSAHERGRLRARSCRELIGLCAAQAPNEVAAALRRYHNWAAEVAELSFHIEDAAVRRTLRPLN